MVKFKLAGLGPGFATLKPARVLTIGQEAKKFLAQPETLRQYVEKMRQRKLNTTALRGTPVGKISLALQGKTAYLDSGIPALQSRLGAADAIHRNNGLLEMIRNRTVEREELKPSSGKLTPGRTVSKLKPPGKPGVKPQAIGLTTPKIPLAKMAFGPSGLTPGGQLSSTPMMNRIFGPSTRPPVKPPTTPGSMPVSKPFTQKGALGGGFAQGAGNAIRSRLSGGTN